MTTHDKAPQPGLTRRATGYPHPLYPGWYLTKAEIRAIERRNRHRYIDTPELDVDDGRTTKTCSTCGAAFDTAIPQQTVRCPQCRAAAGRRRRKGTG